METTTLKVEGMSCGGCVKSVTNVLTALPAWRRRKSRWRARAPRRVRGGPRHARDMKRVIVDAGFEAE